MENPPTKLAILQQEISEKQQRIHKLKSELFSGQQQLKDLSAFLSNNLDRLTFKKPSSSKDVYSIQENPDFLQKLLDCGHKRKSVLKKDLVSLKNLQASASVDKVGTLEKLLKEKEKRLEDGRKELKNLKHLIRVLEKTVLDYQNTEIRDSKLQENIEKMLHLRQKLAVLRENFSERVKNDQKKTNFIEKLEKKLAEIDPQGLSNNVSALRDWSKDNGDLFWKMRAKVLLLKKTIQRENKTFSYRNKQSQKALDEICIENREMEARIREKNKELELLEETNRSFDEKSLFLKRKKVSLKPLTSDISEKFSKEHIRKLQFSSITSPFIKKIVRSSMRLSQDVIDFNDNAYFPEKNPNFTVSALHFFIKNSIIIGFQQEFSGKHSFEGLKNMVSPEGLPTNYTTQSFFLQKRDFIVDIQGKIATFVENLNIFTKKGECFQVNPQGKVSKYSQNFEISVQSPWKLRSLFGGFDFLPKKNVWALVYLGVEMNIFKEPKTNISGFKDEFFARNAEFITQIQGNSEKRGKSAVVLKHLSRKV